MGILTRAVAARPDWAAIWLIVTISVAMRLAFATSAPPFLNSDSPSYYLPARALADGQALDLGLHRTPTYPVVIAIVIAIFGEDLQKLVTVQHFAFGPITAVLAYVFGCLVTRRVIALVAAILVAVSGPLLLYEHYVMSEALFTPLLLATLAAAILAA